MHTILMSFSIPEFFGSHLVTYYIKCLYSKISPFRVPDAIPTEYPPLGIYLRIILIYNPHNVNLFNLYHYTQVHRFLSTSEVEINGGQYFRNSKH